MLCVSMWLANGQYGVASVNLLCACTLEVRFLRNSIIPMSCPTSFCVHIWKCIVSGISSLTRTFNEPWWLEYRDPPVSRVIAEPVITLGLSNSQSHHCPYVTLFQFNLSNLLYLLLDITVLFEL